MGIFEHRSTLPHRASLNNAADTHFRTSTSLVYHYLDVDDDSIVYGDFNAIEELTLRCGIYNRMGKVTKGWNVNGRGQGSNTNYSTHLRNHHKKIWDEVQLLDKAAINPGAVTETDVGQLQNWLSEKVMSI